MDDSDSTLIARFEGRGTRNTRPFEVPEDVLYFTFRWNIGGDGGQIGVNSVESPNDPLELIEAEPTGESIFYGSGTYYFSVAASSDWVIEVEVSSDSWVDGQSESEDSDTGLEVSETSLQNQNWGPSWAQIGDFYVISPTWSEEKVAQIRQVPTLNFVDDLDRGYLISTPQQLRLNLQPRAIRKIRETVLELDDVMRKGFPDFQDNFPNPPTPIRPLDEREVSKVIQQGLKVHLSLSNILRKEGSQSAFLIASGVRRIQYVSVSSARSTNEREARREANLEQMDRYWGAQRAASAWFDEAKRRGY